LATYPKTRLLTICLILSVAAHILTLYGWRMFGTYHFSAPVNQSQSVVFDLAKPADTASPEVTSEKPETFDSDHLEEDGTDDNSPSSTMGNDNRPPISSTDQRPDSTPDSEAAVVKSPEDNYQPVTATPGYTPLSTVVGALSTKNEKLTYLISMFGLPVGSAELEAEYKRRSIWLTLRVKSNAAISNIFPVDNIVVTRLRRNFIRTNIKQQEGSFKSDEGFTIDLIEKRVSWFDNIRSRSLTKTIPTNEVLDTLSGIYFLRNRQLEIGKTEKLHIFDSETYAEVPVEILRRETLLLPNLTKVDTLVIQPLQKSAGIFRRTGDILIWMTDDDYKVPVKIVTSVALGKVTIELLSAESKPQEEDDE
jgi:hypothetical protein